MISADHKNQTAIVIPAHNEATVLPSLIKKIKSAGWPQIIVVDDGSADQTATLAKQAGALVLRHRVNRGKGAATKTGLDAARSLNPSYLVTMDGDGQHAVADLDLLIHPLIDHSCDVVLGTRQFQMINTPTYRRLTNWTVKQVVRFLFGLKVSDSQCGFRAFSRHSLNFLQTSADRYEYETEVIKELRRHRLTYTEVPIQTIYTHYSLTKNSRQNLFNGLITLYKLLWKSLSF